MHVGTIEQCMKSVINFITCCRFLMATRTHYMKSMVRYTVQHVTLSLPNGNEDPLHEIIRAETILP
jgi:hypothetical protein